jgi:hypothetical protein
VILHTRRSCFRSRSDVPKGWVRVGRCLVLLNIVVLILSSFTEHYWTWDRFLRGGQDFELSLLALLAFFCLILVFALYFRRGVSELLRQRNGISTICEPVAVPLSISPLVVAFSSERPPGLCAVILRI